MQSRVLPEERCLEAPSQLCNQYCRGYEAVWHEQLPRSDRSVQSLFVSSNICWLDAHLTEAVQNTPNYSLKALGCSKPGDYIQFEALKDCICAASCCPYGELNRLLSDLRALTSDCSAFPETECSQCVAQSISTNGNQEFDGFNGGKITDVAVVTGL